MKAAIVAHYDPECLWRGNFLSMLEVLTRVVERIVVVTTSAHIGDLPASLPSVDLVRRPNIGYDFYSYRVGHAHLLRDHQPESLYILNSSLVLLDAEKFQTLLEDLASAARSTAARAVTSSTQLGWHLQSYLLYVDLGKTPRGWLARFLDRVEPQNTKLETILHNEIGFGRCIEEDGVAAEALFAPPASYQAEVEKAGIALSEVNWTHWACVELAARWGFAKGELLRSNPHQLSLDEVWAAASPVLLPSAKEMVDATEQFYKSDGKGLTQLSQSKGTSLVREWVQSNRHRVANARVAVALHLFYVDLLEELLGYLESICEPFDLFITTPFEADIPRILATTAKSGLAVTIALTENRGRDVGPFLSLLRAGLLDKYDAVLKLHSKKSLYSEQGRSWRRQLLAPLCGDSLTVFKSLALVRREQVGIVGPTKYFLTNENYWGANKDTLRKILAAGGLRDAADPGLAFFAGTMFWFKPATLTAIHDMPEEVFAFEDEDGKQDGTLAHAWERAFCQLARGAGFRAAVIDSPDEDLFALDHSEKRVPVLKH
jgi:lipopolysaccharide biosynthesis protein